MTTLFRAMTAVIGLMLGLATMPAMAQQPVPPTHYSTDERGVDLTSGAYYPSVTEVVIGQPGAGGMSHGRSHIGTGWRDAQLGTINSSPSVGGTTYTVSIGGYSDQFDLATGTTGPYLPAIQTGASLTYAAGVYTYTTSDGTVAIFSDALAASTTPYTANVALLASVTSPNGETQTYTYRRTRRWRTATSTMG